MRIKTFYLTSANWFPVTASTNYEVTVLTQGLREFVNEVNTLASFQHPNLCKLLGFHARDGSEQRMLVYERLFHGSLDRLLYSRSEGPLIDWNSRMKIALCAAQGLAFLHEEGPFQVIKLVCLIHVLDMRCASLGLCLIWMGLRIHRRCTMNFRLPTYRLTKTSVQNFLDMVVLDIFPIQRYPTIQWLVN